MRLGQGNLPLLSRYFMTVLICCTVASASQGQSKTMTSNFSTVAKTGTAPIIRPLSIGDQVPDIIFENVLNYKSKKARLSDFKGKLVILDMWSTWCTSCIAAFPKMEKLQEQFKDKIQIILTNPSNSKYDSEDNIKSTLYKLKSRTGFYPSLPVTMRDTVLNTLFPHQSVPHIVIINNLGKLIGITYPYTITEENIQSILAGKVIDLPLKNDWAYNKDGPLLLNGNGGSENDFLFRSILTKYKQGIGSFIGKHTENNGTRSRLTIINYPLRMLFQIAYGDVLNLRNNRTLLELEDPSKFEIDNATPNKFANAYCYELITPYSADSIMLQHMRDDLSRNFGVTAKREFRTIKCYSLKTNNNITKSISNTDNSEIDIEQTSLNKFIRNMPVSTLTEMLNTMLPMPVIDETGINKNITLKLPFDWYKYTIEQMRNYLSARGFDLIETDQNLEVAVITDKHQS